MPLGRWLPGRKQATIIVVAFVVVTVGAAVHAWVVSDLDPPPVARPSILPPSHANDPEALSPVPIPYVEGHPLPPIQQPATRPHVTASSKDLAPTNRKRLVNRFTVPLPNARPRIWLVKPDEGTLAYGESELVWCPEEYISSNGCRLPLVDLFSTDKQLPTILPRAEFVVGDFGITHVPTGTKFLAYRRGPRFGFFSNGNFDRPAPNGKTYEDEEVRQAMIHYWRNWVDSFESTKAAE
jgi:hypothetical protein